MLWFFVILHLARLALPPPPPTRSTGPLLQLSQLLKIIIVMITTTHRNGPGCLEDLDASRAVCPAPPSPSSAYSFHRPKSEPELMIYSRSSRLDTQRPHSHLSLPAYSCSRLRCRVTTHPLAQPLLSSRHTYNTTLTHKNLHSALDA